MTGFLVESYRPRSTGGDMTELAHDLAVAAESLGLEVRFVRAISVPEDEICFFFFEAESADGVKRVTDRAGLSHERIVETRP